MKSILIFLLVSALSLNCLAEVAVQRTPESSYSEFQKYLQKSGKTSFAQAYITLSSVTEMETPLLERCLEEVYLGAPAQSTCLSAVKSLSSKPLNQPRREVLFSFLSKLEKVKSPQKNFYRDMRLGLLRTHENLAKTFGATIPEQDEKLETLQNLEMNAWRKAVSKMIPLEEVSLLINGKKVSKLEKWNAPQGVYQWSLVTNTHEPLVRISTFSQFAADSLKELKPLASASCDQLSDFDPKKFGLLQMEIFSNPKCVAQFGIASAVAKSPHLGNSASMVQIEKSNRHWVWPILVAVGAGIALSLKDKQVSVQMPGAH
jgi:hypothetical protein